MPYSRTLDECSVTARSGLMCSVEVDVNKASLDGAAYSQPWCWCKPALCPAGIAGFSGLEGNLALAGVTGFLGAFLAFQVMLLHCERLTVCGTCSCRVFTCDTQATTF